MKLSRTRVFFLESTYLLALVAVLVVYEHSADFRDFLPESLSGLPVATPWFGALGGVMISLTGVFKHRSDWDESLTEWHIARPLVGGVIGSMGALILVVVVNTANTREASANPAFYNIVGFLLGYREETFRSLIKRATDIILGRDSETTGR